MSMHKVVDGQKILLTPQEEAAWEAGADDRKADEVRTLRDELLASTDWWAVADRKMTEAETAYRQALRNISQQAGFPNDITWPQEPSA